MTFQEKLRRRVDELGLNMARAARLVGLPSTAISAYLAKKDSIPRADIALKIARALDVPLEWLVDDSAEWPPPTSALTDARLLAAELGRRMAPVVVPLLSHIIEAEGVDWVAAAQELMSLDPRKPLSERLARIVRLPTEISELIVKLHGLEPVTSIPADAPANVQREGDVRLMALVERMVKMAERPGYGPATWLTGLWAIPPSMRPPWFDENIVHAREKAAAKLAELSKAQPVSHSQPRKGRPPKQR